MFWNEKNAKYNCAYYALGDINKNLLNVHVPNDGRIQQYVNTHTTLPVTMFWTNQPEQ